MLLERAHHRTQEKRQTGLLRQRRTAQGAATTRQTFDDAAKPMLMFASNDYLGLAHHPAVIQAIQDAVQHWGVGAGASHLISGHTQAHADLETALASSFAPYIHNVRALTFSTGYMANMAVLTTLGEADAHLFSDELNHASLIDGCRLARASVSRYAHVDMVELEQHLSRSQAPIKLIVTDGVFSMDGDLAPLPVLLALAQQYNAWVMVDDAHGLGVLGTLGHGLVEHYAADLSHIAHERLIWVGTFGKALGVAGAFVAAPSLIIEWLIQSARSYIYTTACPPALACAVQTSLHWVQCEWGQQQRQHLQALIQYWLSGLACIQVQRPQLPWRALPSITPIQPLWVGTNADALQLSDHLAQSGIYVPAIRPPTVAAGQARLRMTLSASHTQADLDQLLHALACFNP